MEERKRYYITMHLHKKITVYIYATYSELDAKQILNGNCE
jgi:hypothetical protein